MKKETIIYLPRMDATFFEIEGYAIALCRFVRDSGGQVWAGWIKGGFGVVLRIQNISRKLLKIGTGILINSAIESWKTLSLIERVVKATPLPDNSAEIPWGTVWLRSQRLSKRLTIQLPNGAYLVSRVATNGRSVFAVRIGKHREALWRQAVEAKAVGKLCYISWSAPQFDEQKDLWIPTFGSQKVK